MRTEQFERWDFEIGLQAWSCRNLMAMSLQEAFRRSSDFDFIELAGHGSEDLKAISEKKEVPFDKIKGAHICSLRNELDEIYSLVDAYVNRFPNLQWIAFFFDYRKFGKNDSYLFDGENKKLANSYKNYADIIKKIENRYKDILIAPKIVYHLYPIDFVPVGSYTIDQKQMPKPAFEILLERGVSIQIDIHFARRVGFDLLNYFSSFSSRRLKETFFEKITQGDDTSYIPLVHSIHLAGFNNDGTHEAIDSSFCGCANSENKDNRYHCPRHYFVDLFELLRQLNCKNLIIEFEQDHDLAKSLTTLKEVRKILKESELND